MIRNMVRDTDTAHEFVTLATRITAHGEFVFLNAYRRNTVTREADVFRKTYRTNNIIDTVDSIVDRFVSAGFKVK